MNQALDQHNANQRLFQAVHDIAAEHAGRPVTDVVEVLRERLPRVPGLAEEEIRRIAEEISVGRDPSGW